MERLISTPTSSPSPSPSQARIRGPLFLPSRRLPAAAAWPRLRGQPTRPGAIALASPLRHEALSAAPEEARSDPPPPAAVGSPWKLLGSLLPKVLGFFFPFVSTSKIAIFRFITIYRILPRYDSAGLLEVGVIECAVQTIHVWHATFRVQG